MKTPDILLDLLKQQPHTTTPTMATWKTPDWTLSLKTPDIATLLGDIGTNSAASILAGMTPTRNDDAGVPAEAGQHAMESNPFAKSFGSASVSGKGKAAGKKRKGSGVAAAEGGPEAANGKRKRGAAASAAAEKKKKKKGASATGKKAKAPKLSAAELALEAKKQRRRERNRIAAAACRQRKVDREDQLRKTLHAEQEELATLLAREVALKKEIAGIKERALKQ